MLKHRHGQLRVTLKCGVQLLTVNGENEAFFQGHGGGDPGTAVKKGCLAHQVASLVHSEHPLLARIGADKATHGAGGQIVEALWPGSL